MGFVWRAVRQGWDLVVGGDPATWLLIRITLEVAAVSGGIALVLGIPVGLAVGLGRARAGSGRRFGAVALTLGNAGLSLPPVVVGIVLTLLMLPAGPLGRYHLLFTLQGVMVAQTVLALPVAVALTASAARSLPPGLLAQARALGAGTHQVWWLALREARIGVMAAVIAAVGSAVSEVGAVVLVGGNIQGSDQTLASAALEEVQAGHFGKSMAIAIVLLGLILLLSALLTVVQLGAGGDSRVGQRVPAAR